MLDDFAHRLVTFGHAHRVATQVDDLTFVDALGADDLFMKGIGRGLRHCSRWGLQAGVVEPLGRAEPAAWTRSRRSTETAISSQLSYLGQRRHSVQTLRGKAATAAWVKPSRSKKPGLVVSAKTVLRTQRDGLIEASPYNDATQALALGCGVDNERLHLGEVFPFDMERTGRDHPTAFADDEEVAQGLVDLAFGARQHVAGLVPPSAG